MNKKDIVEILNRIDRPFLSEMDFQFWFIKKLARKYPGSVVIPEFPYARDIRSKNQYLDIFVKTGNKRFGIELKYKTKAERVVVGDYYNGLLKNQGAHDISRYDYVWDINRLEYMVDQKMIKKGFTIILSNDKAIWNKPGRNPVVDIDVRFRDYDDTLKTIPKHIDLEFYSGLKYPSFDIKGNYQVPRIDLDLPKLEIQYYYSLNEVK